MSIPLTDRHDRTHRSLRISIVDKCDLRCTYCMPEDQHFLRKEELMTRAEIAAYLEQDLKNNEELIKAAKITLEQ
mgnify:CR=1 FL=1